MLDLFSSWFTSSGFMPHGYCFLWSPSLLWVDVASDLLTAASYLSIPFALWYFVQRRPDVPFRWVFMLFGAFVLACGVTHLFAIWNIWHADYWAEAGAKALTAAVSVLTAILLWPLLPKALSIPSTLQLESANRELKNEVLRREYAESTLRTANESLESRVAERTTELERTTHSLRQNEARFRSLTAMSADWYWEQDANLRFVLVSKPDTGQADIDSNTFLGHTRRDAPGVAWDEPELAQLEAIVAARKPFSDFEIGRVYRDGQRHYVRMSGEPLFDAAGQFAGYRGVGTDITERRRAEDEIQRRDRELLRFRAAMDATADAVYLVDRASLQFLDVNKAACQFRGQTRERILELGPQRVLVQSREELERAYDAVIARGGEAEMTEVQGQGKDGSQFTVEISRSALQSGDGWTIVSVARDITARKAAEAKIQRLTQLYSALSQCNEAIVRCRSEGELFQRICRDAVRFGGMQMAWIGLIEPATRMIRIAASFGDRAEEYLQDIEISVDADSPLGRGPSAVAIRDQQPVWWQDFQHQAHTAPWHERRARFGWGALAALPLYRNGASVGVICLYATEVGAFDEAARGLLTEMATDISFALDNFEREAARERVERELRAAEEQFRGLVEQSIAGIYIIQDGKLAYVNPRAAEIVGQGTSDDLIGTDPLQWVVAADRARFAESLRPLLKGETQSLALDFGVLRRDGVAVQVGAHAARATHQGKPAVIGLVQDISEKKRAEEQIERYVAQLQNAFLSTVEVATSLSEMRDPYTAGHERRVGAIAAAIGAEMGFDAQRIEGMRVAGFLHDIGKITIPAEILSKPGKLSTIEYQLIKGHSQSSYDVLKGVEFPWPVAQVALQHHERMDGSGYPQGLKGEAILLEARILAVADVVEAMSSHRPYRAGLGMDNALAEIERGRGSVYDPSVADACLRLFREKRYELPT